MRERVCRPAGVREASRCLTWFSPSSPLPGWPTRGKPGPLAEPHFSLLEDGDDSSGDRCGNPTRPHVASTAQETRQ